MIPMTEPGSPRYDKLIEILVRLRRAQNLTQRDLCKKLKTPEGKPIWESYVGKVEKGKRRLDVLEFIEYCRALDVDPVTIFREVL